MHDTWKCTSVTQVNGLRSTSDYDYKIRGDASFSFYSSCDSPEYDQVRLIHTADSRHQLCLTFDGYDMQRLDFHHALRRGPFGWRPFNRVAFCRHFTGYSMFFTQSGAREKVTRSKKPTLYLMRFEFAFLYNCRECANFRCVRLCRPKVGLTHDQAFSVCLFRVPRRYWGAMGKHATLDIFVRNAPTMEP